MMELIANIYLLSKDPQRRTQLVSDCQRSSSSSSSLSLEGNELCAFLQRLKNNRYFLFDSTHSFDTTKKALIGLRNFCFGDELVSPLMIESTAVEQVIEFAKTAVRKNTSPEQGDDEEEEEEEEEGDCVVLPTQNNLKHLSNEEISQLLTFSCQFLSNFVSTSNQLADYFIDHVGADLLHLLAAGQKYKNPKAIGILWGILFTLICSSKFGYERRVQKFFSHRSLLCGMFLSLQSLHSPNIHPNQSSSSSNPPSSSEPSKTEVDPMDEWTQLFLLEILKHGRVTRLFHLLDSQNSETITSALATPSSVSSNDSPSGAIVNLEQIILVHLVMVLLEDKAVIQEVLSCSLSLPSSSSSHHAIDLVHFLLACYEKFQAIDLPKLWLETMNNNLPPAPSSSSSKPSAEQIQQVLDDKERSFHQSIYQDFSLVYLELLTNLLAQLTDLIPSPPIPRVEARPTLVQEIKLLLCEETKLIDLCIETIEHWDFISRLKIERASSPSSALQKQMKVILNPFQKEFIKSSLQLTSHVFYLNPFTQRAMENRAILHCLLAYSVTDIDLPLGREWALLSIRNLCESSEKVREYIHSLKPQEVVVEDDFLSKIKADISLDPATGKLIFRQKE